jgi:hypothetical protein
MGGGVFPAPQRGGEGKRDMDEGQFEESRRGSLLTSTQKALFQEIETSIKQIYKMALDILSEIGDKEEAAIDKLTTQQPQTKALAPFLLVLDDVQYGLYRSRILDMANTEIRKIKEKIKEVKVVQEKIDIVRIKNGN